MQPSTIKQLIDLNRQFYQSFARPFSASRQRLQPGVRRLLPEFSKVALIIDLGCGNGELANTLYQQGFKGHYLGLDFSAELIEEARQRLRGQENVIFLQADLSDRGWPRQINAVIRSNNRDHADAVLAFAALHHLPGETLRRQVMLQCHQLLNPQGYLFVSVWQFTNSPRLRQRILPWSAANLAETDVDPGDYLLDWRQGGTGLRYVHLFSQDELALLAETCGFRVSQSFYSDGEGGQLGLYQSWTSKV
jgi:SAM-dependent methyltransferase